MFEIFSILRYCHMLQMFETFCLLGSLYSRADIRCFPLWSKVSEREHNTETFNNQALFNSNWTHFGEGKRSQWKVFDQIVPIKTMSMESLEGYFFIFWALYKEYNVKTMPFSKRSLSSQSSWTYCSLHFHLPVHKNTAHAISVSMKYMMIVAMLF